MKNTILFIGLILLLGSYNKIISQSYSAEMVGDWNFDGYNLSYFINGYIKNNKIIPEKKADKVPFTINVNNGITFLNVNNEKYIKLQNDLVLIIFSSDGTRFFEGVTGSGRSIELIFSPNKISASSFLSEANIQYIPNNIIFNKLDFPWVEGVVGDGINETLTISFPTEMKSLLFCNGFISFNKPYLYNYNNRVKKMIIKDSSGNQKEVVLEDKPDPQLIDLNYPAKDFVLQITDVYHGEKYKDTCISMVKGIQYFK